MRRTREGEAVAIPGRRRHRFTLSGLVYVSVTAFVAAGAVTSQNNLLFWALGVALAGILLSGLISGAAMMGLRIDREPIGDCAAGDPMIIRYRVTNVNRLVPAFGLVIEERDGAGRGLLGLGRRSGAQANWSGMMARPMAYVAHVGAGRTVHAEAVVRATRRGEAIFDGLRVSSGFPFGLAAKSVNFRTLRTGIVHPARVALRASVLAGLSGGGDQGGRERARGDDSAEPYGVREYNKGDPARSIAWRASARRGELVVREPARPVPRRVWVVLRLGCSGEAGDAGVEGAMELAANVLRACAGMGLGVGLCVPDQGLVRHPRVGEGGLRELLAELAVVGPLQPGAVAGDEPAVVGRDRCVEVVATRSLRRGGDESICLAGDEPETWREGAVRAEDPGERGACLREATGARIAASGRWAVISGMIASAAYAGAGGGHWALLTLAMVCVAGWATRGRPVLALPRFVAALAVFGAIGWMAQRGLSAGLGVDDLCGFLAMLLAIKVADGRSASDDGQVLALSVLLTLASVLVSNSLSVGGFFVLLGPVVGWGAMGAQVRGACERVEASRRRNMAGGESAPPVEEVSSPRARQGLRRVHGVTLAAGLAFAACVFIVVPRGVGLGQFGRWSAGGRSVRVTGFSDRMDVGAGGAIAESREPVMYVRVSDEDGRPLGGEGSVYLMRGAVLDRYDGRSWWSSRSPTEVQDGHLHEGGTELSLGGGGGAVVISQEVTLLNASPGNQYLFALWRPQKVRVVDRATLVRSPRLSEKAVVVRGVSGRFRYEVLSASVERDLFGRSVRRNVQHGTGATWVIAEEALRAAQIEPDPAVRSLDDDSAAVTALVRFVRSRCEYSLEGAAPPPGVDAVSWFLLDGRRGHCEHFASALAALCRSVGIQARVVTGYAASEYDARIGAYVVRQRDAHAWVEAETDPGVWRTFDATPPGALQEVRAAGGGLLAGAGRVLDSLNYFWVTTVVSYDSGARESLLGWSAPMSEEVDAGVKRLVEGARLAGPRAVARTVVRIVLAVVGGATAAVLVIGLLRRWRAARANRPRSMLERVEQPGVRRALASSPVYQRMLAACRRAGHPKPAWQPSLSFARSLGLVSEGAGARAREISERFYAIRFGGERPSETELARSWEALTSLERELADARRAGR